MNYSLKEGFVKRGPSFSFSVSHLQFADGTLSVGVKSWTNVRALKVVLILFEEISCLKINFHKCMLFGVNVVELWLHEAALVMNCKHGRLPLLYLRLLFGGDPRKIQFLYPLIRQIRRRLLDWKSRNLSLGVGWFFISTFCPPYRFILSFFKALSSIISSLESNLSDFYGVGVGILGKCLELNGIFYVCKRRKVV